MSQLRARTAVSPLRRGFSPAADAALPQVFDLVAVERPEEPMHCLRPAAIVGAARAFVAGFPDDVLYAVKCNPEPAVLRALWTGGVRHFDCASIGEVALVRTMFPDAHIAFMHPVKARGAIREVGELLAAVLAAGHGEQSQQGNGLPGVEGDREAVAQHGRRSEQRQAQLRHQPPPTAFTVTHPRKKTRQRA